MTVLVGQCQDIFTSMTWPSTFTTREKWRDVGAFEVVKMTLPHSYCQETWPRYVDLKMTFGVGTWGGLMTFSCLTGCQGLSLEPRGRSRSFLVHRSIWLSFPHIQTIVTLAAISWPWENFLVSMATKLFPWKRTSPYFFRAPPGPPCQVWPQSVHKWRSSFRTNAATDATQIIVRCPTWTSLPSLAPVGP